MREEKENNRSNNWTPNTTPIHNQIVAILPKLTNKELRVFIAISAITLSWLAPYASFENIQEITGFDKKTIISGLEKCLKRDTIEIVEIDGIQYFRLNFRKA